MNFKELDNNTLDKLHAVEIEILDEIVRICDKYNLSYFLAGGTLLGAIRHNGFIPWDDDLDITMPRKDYDIFLSVCEKELNSKYLLDYDKTNSKNWLTFAKIRKKNTLFLENAAKEQDNFKGIYVDIFTEDNVINPNSFIEKIRLIIIKTLADTLFWKSKVGNDKSKYRRFYLVKIFSILSFKQIHSLYNKLVTKYKNKDTEYFVAYNGVYTKREYLKKSEFLPFIKWKFGNKEYNIPKGYDYYLTKLYGNYMKLPPKKDRVNHSALMISFDTTKKDNFEK